MDNDYVWDIAAEMAKSKMMLAKQRTGAETKTNTSENHVMNHNVVATPSKEPFPVDNAVKGHDKDLVLARDLAVASAIDSISTANRRISVINGYESWDKSKHIVRFYTEPNASEDFKFAAFLAMNSAEMGYTNAAMIAAAIRWGLRDIDVVSYSVIKHETKPVGFDDALVLFKTYFEDKAKIINFFSSKAVACAVLVGASVFDIAAMIDKDDKHSPDNLFSSVGYSMLSRETDIKTIFSASIAPYLSARVVLRRCMEAEACAFAAAGVLASIVGSIRESIEAMSVASAILSDIVELGKFDPSMYYTVSVDDACPVSDTGDVNRYAAMRNKIEDENAMKDTLRRKLVRFRLDVLFIRACSAAFIHKAKRNSGDDDIHVRFAGLGRDITVVVGLCVVAAAFIAHKAKDSEAIPHALVKVVATRKMAFNSIRNCFRSMANPDFITLMIKEYCSINLHLNEVDNLYCA